MAGFKIHGAWYANLFVLLVMVLCSYFCGCRCSSVPYNSFTVSSFSYPQIKLGPYAWQYIRVELPSSFSLLSIALESDVELDAESIKKLPKSRLPLICIGYGSPPLPETPISSRNPVIQYFSNASFGGVQGIQDLDHCYPLLKNISAKLTNEEISSGVWYIGIFNGIGLIRTQSKMITRGPTYSFTANISVEGCVTPALWGQYCNRTVEPLLCSPNENIGSRRSRSDSKLSGEDIVYCANSITNSCHQNEEPKVFSLDITGIEQLSIVAENVRINEMPPVNNSGFTLMGFARQGAIPSATLHDYSGSIDDMPLVISSPMLGRWYITILPVNISKRLGEAHIKSIKLCYTIKWKVLKCPDGMAGFNCTWEKYMLQTILRKDPTSPFASYYLPLSGKLSSDSGNFLIEPLLSNVSSMGELDDAWTYFLLDIPRGAAGGNVHVRLTAFEKMHYEIYARFGGLPSRHSWDYFYTNRISGSSGGRLGKLNNASEEISTLYIFNIREGTLSFGLRRQNFSHSTPNGHTAMSISLERCPKRCSYHGTCRSVLDISGFAVYSFCYCDRDHGGFDCSIEMITHLWHTWQSVSLIASNVAAVLPAFWALREKAFAEWVLFTSSGISSGLYHACDVGTWCVVNFRALQFMDFWISFMAVASTFVYLTDTDEVFRRTIHTGISILTAFIAVTDATRPTNILFVIAFGALGLLTGWMIELSRNNRSISLSMRLCFDMNYRWQSFRGGVHTLVKTLNKRFRWGLVLAAFVALAMAGISWTLETAETYWIWHSVWHIIIYTASFLFLCSKVNIADRGNPQSLGNYELAPQVSRVR